MSYKNKTRFFFCLKYEQDNGLRYEQVANKTTAINCFSNNKN